MIARLTLAAAMLATAAPVLATGNQPVPEARIRNIGSLLETVPDPRHGVYIRDYRGQWYYARTRDECPRLNHQSRLRLIPSPGGHFDRNSAISADGWRCLITSVVASDGPARRHR
jgi:hypothetical protein